MPLHLIKLCVGIDSLDDLRARRARRAAEGMAATAHTRHAPKRVEELLDGGSLYWVIKGVVLARQRLLGFERREEAGQAWCEIVMDGTIHPTAPQPRRAFQGWRYLPAADAPPDLALGDDGEAMPEDLARQLREMGAW
jgi:hypothetical protein